MPGTNEPENKVQGLITHLKEYINLKSDLIGLQVRRITADMISGIAASASLLVFLFFTFLFLSIAAAFYLNEVLQNSYGGFLVIAGLYFLLSLMMILFRSAIRDKVAGTIILQMFKEDDDEEEDQ